MEADRRLTSLMVQVRVPKKVYLHVGWFQGSLLVSRENSFGQESSLWNAVQMIWAMLGSWFGGWVGWVGSGRVGLGRVGSGRIGSGWVGLKHSSYISRLANCPIHP